MSRKTAHAWMDGSPTSRSIHGSIDSLGGTVPTDAAEGRSESKTAGLTTTSASEMGKEHELVRAEMFLSLTAFSLYMSPSVRQ